MGTRQRLLDRLRVTPGEAAGLVGRDPGWSGGSEFPELAAQEVEQRAKDAITQGSTELSDAQELLWASDRYALLVVLQAMDAAGKDSVIKHVMSGVNPQGVQVVPFRKPSAEELDHDFSGGSRARCRSAAASASSTGRTTRRSSRSRCTRSGSSRSASRQGSAASSSGRSATRTSTPSSATWIATGRRS
jgi:hypothetical protein